MPYIKRCVTQYSLNPCLDLILGNKDFTIGEKKNKNLVTISPFMKQVSTKVLEDQKRIIKLRDDELIKADSERFMKILNERFRNITIKVD
jgi:hypothetical protein